MAAMKHISKIVFGLYLICLLWLVLFKTSLDFSSVLSIDIRSLNLTLLTGRLSEAIENFIVFVPFGLLLSVNFKKVTFWQKFICIFIFSLAVETTQYVLAIGISDITDILTNTLGGLFGLATYSAGKRLVDSKKIDCFIVILIGLLIVFFLALRFFVFRVKY
jgi:glycopeptide antibiotics resistance protein